MKHIKNSSSGFENQIKSAVEKNEQNKLLKLLEKKADVNTTDKNGNTLLHLACARLHLDMIKFLIDNNAKTYIVNKKFQRPIQYAGQLAVVVTLLSSGLSQIEEYVKNRIEFVLGYYDFKLEPDSGYNQELLDYAVSHLIGCDIRILQFGKENRWKYLGHLLSLEGNKYSKTPVKLEGFTHEKFLSMRVRSFFEILIKIMVEKLVPQNIDKKSSGNNQQEWIDLLQKQISNILNSLHLYQHANILMKKFSNSARFEDGKNELIRSILRSIYHLKEKQELNFPGGWSTHAVYINFVRKRKNIFIRVDNLGAGYNRRNSENKYFHQRKEDDNERIYPAILGKFPLNSFDPGCFDPDGEDSEEQPGQYISNILQAKFFKEKAEAVSLIYDYSNFEHAQSKEIEQLGYNPTKIQSVGNCVGKSHQVALKARLGRVSYKWLKIREAELATAKAKTKSIKKNHQKFWDKEGIAPPKTMIFSNHFRKLYKKLQLERLFIDVDMEKGYVPLKLRLINNPDNVPVMMQTRMESLSPVDESELIKYQNMFDECKDDKKILILGGAGIGKTALCRYIAYQWAKGKNWADLFSAVILIRLQNLNADCYRDQTQELSLVDILHGQLKLESNHEDYGCNINSESIRRWLSNEDHKQNTLWILDGYNEIERPLPKKLSKTICQLLKMSNLILTTTALEYIPKLAFTKTFQLVGFNDKKIDKYLEKNIKNRKKITELLQLIRSNIDLADLVRTPMFLEIVCSSQLANLKLEKISTAGKLYQQMIQILTHEFIKKPEGIRLLESLAFNSLVNKVTSIDSDNFYRSEYRDQFDKFTKSRILIEFEKNKFRFIHLTFQQFMAACYIKEQFVNKPSKEHDRTILWIKNHKYDKPHFELLGFLSELLACHEDSEGLELFWETLASSPRDIIGLHHLRLTLYCSSKILHNGSILVEKNIIKNLKSFIETLLNRQMAGTETSSMLFELLPLINCKNIFSYLGIEKFFLNILAKKNKNWSSLIDIMQVFGRFFYTEKIVEYLSEELQDFLEEEFEEEQRKEIHGIIMLLESLNETFQIEKNKETINNLIDFLLKKFETRDVRIKEICINAFAGMGNIIKDRDDVLKLLADIFSYTTWNNNSTISQIMRGLKDRWYGLDINVSHAAGLALAKLGELAAISGDVARAITKVKSDTSFRKRRCARIAYRRIYLGTSDETTLQQNLSTTLLSKNEKVVFQKELESCLLLKEVKDDQFYLNIIKTLITHGCTIWLCQEGLTVLLRGIERLVLKVEPQNIKKALQFCNSLTRVAEDEYQLPASGTLKKANLPKLNLSYSVNFQNGQMGKALNKFKETVKSRLKKDEDIDDILLQIAIASSLNETIPKKVSGKRKRKRETGSAGLIRNAEQRSYKCINVTGDGSCLFYSILFQLSKLKIADYGRFPVELSRQNELKVDHTDALMRGAQKLRSIVADELEIHGEDYTHLLPEGREGTPEGIRHRNTWGGCFSVRLLVNAFVRQGVQIAIAIVSHDTDAVELVRAPGANRLVVIGFEGDHYRSLIPNDDKIEDDAPTAQLCEAEPRIKLISFLRKYQTLCSNLHNTRSNPQIVELNRTIQKHLQEQIYPQEDKGANSQLSEDIQQLTKLKNRNISQKLELTLLRKIKRSRRVSLPSNVRLSQENIFNNHNTRSKKRKISEVSSICESSSKFLKSLPS